MFWVCLNVVLMEDTLEESEAGHGNGRKLAIGKFISYYFLKKQLDFYPGIGFTTSGIASFKE